MKKDKQKYHYETQTVYKNETSFYVGIAQVVLFIIMSLCGMAVLKEPTWTTGFFTSPYWFFLLAGLNLFGAFNNLEGNMGEEKKVRVYDKPTPPKDALKENVSDKDALNDILGGK